MPCLFFLMKTMMTTAARQPLCRMWRNCACPSFPLTTKTTTLCRCLPPCRRIAPSQPRDTMPLCNRGGVHYPGEKGTSLPPMPSRPFATDTDAYQSVSPLLKVKREAAALRYQTRFPFSGHPRPEEQKARPMQAGFFIFRIQKITRHQRNRTKEPEAPFGKKNPQKPLKTTSVFEGLNR